MGKPGFLRDKNATVLSFQIKPLYCEREVEEMLEMMERRGAFYLHMGDGIYKLRVPDTIPWIPFFLTIKACGSVHGLSVTTFSPEQAKAT